MNIKKIKIEKSDVTFEDSSNHLDHNIEQKNKALKIDKIKIKGGSITFKG
jgi:hypothetical protein